MKRNVILVLLCIFCFSKINAQIEAENDRKKWGSIGISVNQLVMFNDWFSDKEMRDYIGTYPYPHIQANLNVRLYQDFGVFLNFGIGKAKRKEIPSDYNNYSTINLSDYYQEITNYVHPHTIIVLHGDIGVYYKFYHKNWIFVPYLGIKTLDYDSAILSYTLKEKETNEKYIMDYGWGADKKFSGDKGSGSLTFKFKTEKKLSEDFNLDFGVEFNLLMNNIYYREQITNFYTQEIIHSKNIKAKRLASVGFSVGVNFR